MIEAIEQHHNYINKNSERKRFLKAQKIYSLITEQRMKDITIQEILKNLEGQDEVNIFLEARRYK